MNGLFNDKVLTPKDIWPSDPVKQALNLTDGKTFMEQYSFLLYLPCPHLVSISPFLLIAGFRPEDFLPLMEHLMMARTMQKKKDGRARPPACNVYDTMHDDNLHDVTSHMRMLHGDVISKTHGPGVNLFKPADDGRRFWVSAKSPVFG